MFLILFISCIVYSCHANLFEEFPAVKCEKTSDEDISFDLSSMGLNSIRQRFVEGSRVTCINLENNDIRTIEEEAFDGLPDLVYLNLAGNHFPMEHLQKNNITTLKSMVLDQSLNNGYLPYNSRNSYYTTTEDPTIYYGGWESMTKSLQIARPRIFLPLLEKLSVNNNNGEDLDFSYFEMPSLTHLYIASNNIRNTDKLIKIGHNLTHLNLDNNEIHMFIGNYPKLRYLSMNGNNIQKICSTYCNTDSLWIQDMPELEYLSLEGNPIRLLEPNVFNGLKKLRFLNLARNPTHRLPDNLFNGLHNLSQLSLAGNTLEMVPELCGLESLEVLLLNDNLINSIDELSFCNLSNLRHINLSGNRLKIVEVGTFKELPVLSNLDLSNNAIESLPENWLGPENIVEFLHLNKNQFQDIANMSLGSMEQLKFLSIANNPIETITVSTIKNLPPNLKIMDISDMCHQN